MRDLGYRVVIRRVSNVNGERTSDLLINGKTYDVYTPITGNINRVVSAIAKKNSQAHGVIIDLSKTTLTPRDFNNILNRVRGTGATNINDIIIKP